MNVGKGADFVESVERPQFRFSDVKVSAFPTIVNVEVFRGGCPCACRHCPVGVTAAGERGRRFGVKGIDLGLYEKIVREVASYAPAVLRIHSVGDPVMWSDLLAALEVGRRNRVKIWIFTSAVTRNRDLLEAMCSKVDVVEVSVNSINRDDYQCTKGVDAFELVVANLGFMSQIRGREGTRLIVSRTQTTDEAADHGFVEYWKDAGLVDDAFVRSYHTYNDLLPSLDGENTATKQQPCLVHWARFNISVEGYAVVCFNELFRERLDSSLIFGNINHESIAETWHGPKLTALRRAEMRGDYSGLPFTDALPCKTCMSCQPLGGSRPTSEFQLAQLSGRPACQDD